MTPDTTPGRADRSRAGVAYAPARHPLPPKSAAPLPPPDASLADEPVTYVASRIPWTRRLSTRLYVVLGAALLVAGALSGWLQYRLGTTEAGYRAVLEGEVRSALDARGVQLRFKMQVQEWKNVLLRGANEADLVKYREAFLAEQREVRRAAGALEATIADPDAKRSLQGFIRAHGTMATQYGAALARFEQAGGRNPGEVDRMVRGQDRAPTELLDQAVAQLEESAARRTAAMNERVDHERLAVAVVAMLVFVLLAFALFRLVRSVTAPVTDIRLALERVAAGDVRSDVAHRSDDELGVLAEATRVMTSNLRTLLGSVRQAAAEVGGAAREMAASASQVDASASEVTGAATAIATASASQTASIQQMASNARLLAERTAQVAGHADVADRSATSALHSAHDGAESASAALVALEAISATTAEVLPASAELRSTAEAIEQFTDSIDAIARQTNLLSINAAIEAARAGEYGRGFAVVAGEIRSLSDQSAETLAHIREMTARVREVAERSAMGLERVQASVMHGEAVIGSSLTALDAITDTIRANRDAVATIVAVVAPQREASEALVHEVAEVAGLAEGNAATAEEVSAATQEQLAAMHEISAASRQLVATAGRLEERLEGFAV